MQSIDFSVGGHLMSIQDQYKILEFKDLGDERGKLVVVEGMDDIPFEIKRVFYIYGSDPEVVRGQHANKKTEFVLINVSGTSKVKVDNGIEVEVIELNRPRMGLYLPVNLWKDMYDFSEDSVLLVLASEHYDSSEYIRDYDQFVKEVGASNE
jgi:dTDP-4-dehydrorhamnose 3,5-epimerase-like enzyme